MLGIQYLREHPNEVRRALALRGADAPLDHVLALDERRRALLTRVEQQKAERNRTGRAIGGAKDDGERQQLIETQRAGAGEIDAMDAKVRELDAELHMALAEFPNLVHPDTPEGHDESSNVVLRTTGAAAQFNFTPKPHWEIGEALGVIDTKRAATMAGTRMFTLHGVGARLQRALIGYFLDTHGNNGYTEMYLPAMVREEAMFASGQLPKFRDNLYHDAEDDYWFVPTAEVPITNLHRNEILDAAALPLRYAAHTPCFRREKMSAGRDVRGIKRVHQFEKVEMYQFTRPENSDAALASMLSEVEVLLQNLALRYRVLQLCSGDLSFSAAISYDLEVWTPGAEEWLEVSSISNCLDFQARRAGIRYRPIEGKGPEFVHTLNGSGLALPRILAAILETYQCADGSVTVPDVLQHRMGNLTQITSS